jgi:CBS domain containing-hemolysin-like protein
VVVLLLLVVVGAFCVFAAAAIFRVVRHLLSSMRRDRDRP